MTNKESLESDLTRIIDNSPCLYEVVIELLEKQIKWLKKARKQEHGGK